MRRAVLFAVILVAAAARSDRIPPVAVAIEHGAILPHEGTARLRVTVDPSGANRELITAIESDDYATAHYEELDGAHAPKTRWVSFVDLPDGEYTATVRLLREGKREVGAAATFIVGQSEPPF